MKRLYATCLLVLIGCGAGDPEGVRVAALHQGVCAQAFRCGDAAWVAHFRARFTSAAACQRALDASPGTALALLRWQPLDAAAGLDQAIASGRLNFDPIRAARCVAELSRVCPRLQRGSLPDPYGGELPHTRVLVRLGETTDCASVYAGTRGAGAACARSEECADGLWCDARGGEGVCARRLREGDACAPTDCDANGDPPLVCEGGRCRALRGVTAPPGGACGVDLATFSAQACDEREMCDQSCLSPTDCPPRCVPLGGEGAECLGPRRPCGPAFVCRAQRCARP